MINSSSESQVVPKGKLYPTFREEKRLKVKKSKLPIKKLDEKVKNVECWC